jgi:hypothetical protein
VLWIAYIGDIWKRNCWRQWHERHATVTLGGATVLALATLGSATRNRSNPICVAHRHLKIIDCLTARVFVVSTVNGRSKKKKPILRCASSGHINKIKQSIFAPSISMVLHHPRWPRQVQWWLLCVTVIGHRQLMSAHQLSMVMWCCLSLLLAVLLQAGLRFIHICDVDLAILLSDVISIETLLSFQIATAGDSDKQVMFSSLCKHHFTLWQSSLI